MSNLRRKMLCSLDKELYILDGLIFQLDGTDKQASGNVVWKDKVGGIEYTNLGSVLEIENGFKFNGTNSSILKGNVVSIYSKPTNYTIEAVFNPTISNGGWAPIISFNDWNDYNIGLQLHIINNEMYVKHSAKASICNYRYNIGNKRLITTSLPGNNQNVIANLVEYSNYNTTDFGPFSNKTYSFVGGRVDDSAYKVFSGNIYAIRLYNRPLSKEEMIYNQTIDIEKYNITI